MKKLVLAFLASIGAFWCNAQHSKPPMTLRALEDSIEKIRQAEHIVGLMVGITSRDSVLFAGNFGHADLENRRKVDKQTLFRMGSNTKMLVALGILKLQTQNKLQIYNELRQVLPDLKFSNNWEGKSPLRLVHLLEHTSGFDDIKVNRMYSLEKRETTGKAAMLHHEPSMVCRWQPGERHAYSNPNYAILGYIIEKTTNKPYSQYLTEVILQPLGMTHTNFNTFSKLPNDVKEYVFRDGKTELVPSVTLVSGPQGAMWSNTDDMLKLLRMYLNKGQPIFDEKVIAEMEKPHSWLGAKEGLKSGYALGNYYTHFYNKYGFRGHNGLTGTCYSTCIYSHELGIGYVIASNSNNPNTKIEELVATFVEQNAPPQQLLSQPLDQKAIAPHLGFYQLVFKTLDGQKTKLLQTAPLVFRRAGMNISTIAFTKNAEGKNVLSMAGVYFEQGSYVWGLVWRGLLIFMLFLILLSGIFAFGSLLGAMRQKLAWKVVLARFMPITALSLLAFCVSKLLEKQQFSYALYKLNDINAETLLIFAGTTFFGIAGMISAYFVFKPPHSGNGFWSKWFWGLVYASMVLLAIVLFNHGFVAMRTWAM
jgi:CubicO group peptidase (beta-lactamase class C family)